MSDIVREYFALTKPKVVTLILFTALIGMLLAFGGGRPSPVLLFWGLLGIGLGAASGAAFNHVIDEKIDNIMARTQKRPLPAGKIPRNHAMIFAIFLGILSMLVLLTFVNVLTAALTFIALIGYAVIYTVYLKRSTPQNIVWGGMAGAAPPVLGWSAVTGSLNTEALLLFLVIFIWTPPHFWALAIKRREEYKKADIPMLPVTHGVAFTKMQILLYSLMLLAVSLLPFVIRMSGIIYLIGALALGFGFVFYAIMLYKNPSDKNAMRTFGYSIFYLSFLFLFLLIDHYARIFIRMFRIDNLY